MAEISSGGTDPPMEQGGTLSADPTEVGEGVVKPETMGFLRKSEGKMQQIGMKLGSTGG